MLLVADLHYTLRQWDWLRAVYARFDVVVVAGDLLDFRSIVPLEAQVVVIGKYLSRFQEGPPILVASGNHDLLSKPGGGSDAGWLQKQASCRIRVDGEFFVLGGVCFSIFPWWETPVQKRGFLQQMEEQSQRVEGRDWVWVHHGPPRGSPVAWNGRDDWGDALLTELVGRYGPRMVLSGHVHQAPFLAEGAWVDEMDGTLFFNGGRQPGGVPTFTVIDFSRKAAEWVSAEGVEEVMLEGGLRVKGD